MKWQTVQICSPLWQVLLPKKPKNIFQFLLFCGFLTFWPVKRPQNSNLTSSAQHNLGVPDLFAFVFFLCDHSFYVKNVLFFYFFAFWLQQSLAKLSKLCQIPPQTFWTEFVLVKNWICHRVRIDTLVIETALTWSLTKYVRIGVLPRAYWCRSIL